MANVYTRAFPATGSGNQPNPNDVRLGTIFGDNLQFVGNCRVPPTDKVADQYQYDTNDSLTGTLVSSGSLPEVKDVREGIVYADGALTGEMILPIEGDVRYLIGFGYQNEFVGTYIPAAVVDVRAGTMYGAGGVEYVGTLICTEVSDGQPTSDLVLQDLVTIQGDSYQATENRAIVWNANSNYPWPDLTDATLSLRGVNDLGEFEYAPEVDQATAPNQSVKLELTSEQADVASGVYRYDLVATLTNGSLHTLARGDWTWQRKYVQT